MRNKCSALSALIRCAYVYLKKTKTNIYSAQNLFSNHLRLTDCWRYTVHISPVHVVLVSLLVDQLSSLFFPFYGWPKKNCSVSGNFLSGSDFFWSTKFLFGIPKFLFSIPKYQSLTKKNSETDQKFPETKQFFFWSTKKNEK